MGAEPRLVGTYQPWELGKGSSGYRAFRYRKVYLKLVFALHHHHTQFQDCPHVFKEVAVALWNLVNFTSSVANQVREEKSAKDDMTTISKVILRIILL